MTTEKDGVITGNCDGTPMYHKKTGKVLLLGHKVEYLLDAKEPGKYEPATFYSVYNEETDSFSKRAFLELPKDVRPCGNGSGQALELENGDILEVLFKDLSVHYDNVFGSQALWYYVTDIDGDSIPELIFPGSAREKYGILLRVYEGKVYGYACILDGLNTDATYLWYEQAGCYRGRSQVYFDGIFYKSRNLTAYDTNDPNNVIYYVEGKETTKEKFDEAESAYSNEELQYYTLDYYPVYVNPFPGG